jgi:ABC-type dipeptide/oligopeptide/nickel transport system permease subunit
MRGFFRIVFASAGGWIGWKIGMHVGLLTAYFASVFGTAVGILAGRRLVENLLD